MIPILYPIGTTNFTTTGLGKLADILSCICSEELNGSYTIEFDYPVTGERFDDLLEGGIITCIAPKYSYSAAWQISTMVFDIYKFDEPINGVVRFYGKSVAHRAEQIVAVGTGYGTGYNFSLKPNAAPGGISFYSSGTTVGGFPISAPKSYMSLLMGEDESIVSELGYDVAPSVQVYAGGSCDVTMYLLSQRGGDYGAEIHFGYNLRDVNRTKDTSGTYNCVVPFWQNAEYIKYITDYVVYPSTAITPYSCVTMDLSSVFQEEPTESDMIQYARNHLDNDMPWLGEDTITADFLNGATIKDGVQVSLGDIVHVYWEGGKIDTKMRVVAYKYDVLAEHYTEMTLGMLSKQFVAITGMGGAVSSAAAAQTGSSVTYDTQSEVPPIFFSVSYRISGSYTYRAKLLSLYIRFNNPPSSGNIVATLADNLRPASGYVISPIYSNSSPYAPIGSAWIDSTGKLTVYYSGTPLYAFFCFAVK